MTKNLNQTTKEQNKDFIIQTLKQEKVATTKQLIALVQERHAMNPEETTNLLIELENENRLHFTKQKHVKTLLLSQYFLSKQTSWFWITLVLAALTTIVVFINPENNMPLFFLRSSIGTVFVLFLPGFTFIRTLFPVKVPIKTSSENMDMVERVVLSFGMSLVLTAIVSLILNYTQWGIRLLPITFSLLSLTIIFATAAILREYETKLSMYQQR